MVKCIRLLLFEISLKIFVNPQKLAGFMREIIISHQTLPWLMTNKNILSVN